MIFRNSVEPAFCVTFELDVTNFLAKVRESNYSFAIAMVAMVYAVCKCANEIEAFRYRFLNGKVVLFEIIDDFIRRTLVTSVVGGSIWQMI